MPSSLPLKSFKPWSATFIVMGTILAVFSLISLTGKTTPYADLNDQIAASIANAGDLPTDERVELLGHLRQAQENALAGKPAEPFAWARLAWLRLATGSDHANAFAALRLSDLISPYSPRQLPERAIMWRQFHSVENPDEQSYQATLWQNAYRLQPEATWNIAARNGLSDEAGEAIKSRDPQLFEEWKARGK